VVAVEAEVVVDEGEAVQVGAEAVEEVVGRNHKLRRRIRIISQILASAARG
jgi:hypothetical protein